MPVSPGRRACTPTDSPLGCCCTAVLLGVAAEDGSGLSATAPAGFSCDGACGIMLQLPLLAATNSSKQLVCLQLVNGSVTAPATHWAAFNITNSSAVCTVDQPGAYLVVQITRLVMKDLTTNLTYSTSPSPAPPASPALGFGELDPGSTAAGSSSTSLAGRLVNSAGVANCPVSCTGVGVTHMTTAWMLLLHLNTESAMYMCSSFRHHGTHHVCLQMCPCRWPAQLLYKQCNRQHRQL